MLVAVGSNQIRLSREQEQHLRRLAARNGQSFGPITTRKEYLQTCIKALPEAQAQLLLSFLERHHLAQTKK